MAAIARNLNRPIAIERVHSVVGCDRRWDWVLSTTRHISQGGVSLQDERWDKAGNVLSGKSAVVGGDPYVLTVHLPQGFRLGGADVIGEKVEIANHDETATVHIVPSATKTVEWKIQCVKQIRRL